MALSAVEIEPGYGVNGLGIVEIEPGYGVNGCMDESCLAGYDDVNLVGYDDVNLVGAFGADDRPWYKRPLILSAIALGVAGAGAGAYMLYR